MELIRFLTTFLVLCVLFLARHLHAESAVSEESTKLAPGYGKLDFKLPEPGTYQLPSMGVAADGNVLDAEGGQSSLHRLYGDKVVLLSFIYSTCSDVNGCPLATSVLYKIKNRLKNEPELANQLRLLTLSFNPEHDTPAVMKNYGREFQEQGVEWHFLTTRSTSDLQPILNAYRQPLQKIYDEQGRDTGTFSHVLRVFLIDRDRQIRNIYSVSFLHPDSLINDIKSLILTSPMPAKERNISTLDTAPSMPGDNKTGYDNKDYQTHSKSLAARRGNRSDLIRWAKKPQLGLPTLIVPADNPLSREKIDLGRKLFFDRRLSLNNTFSCAMCHIPEQGFTSNEMATAVGIEGRTVRRNSPTLYNVGYLQTLFHDGRETTLEQQVWAPLLAVNEMANPSIGYIIEKIKALPDYHGLFQKIFKKPPAMETIGMAIASYERTLNSGDSSFDQWYYGHRKNALTSKAQSGFKLFTGKANCSQCHSISDHQALFTDQGFHNTGIGYDEAMKRSESTRKVQVAPGVFIEVDAKIVDSVAERKGNDLGRYEVTQRPEHRWQYKTPSLRNVALTAPYMHNGRLATLRQVIEFYNQGGIVNENLDPLIKPLNLTSEEMDDLVEFLLSLTGRNVDELVSDAFAAPIGDVQK